MNINASNHSLDNVFIQQKTEKKRPSFASVFEKLNKRVEKMNRKTPLNNVLTNEQLFRYYVKEVEPLLKKSNDDFGEGNISLGDIMRNLKSNMNEAGGTDGGNPPEEPPVDENVPPYGVINNPNSNNRFSVLEALNEDDEEAGAPLSGDIEARILMNKTPMRFVLENSHTTNAVEDGEASFNANYIQTPDGTRHVFSNDGSIRFSIQKTRTDVKPPNEENITFRNKKPEEEIFDVSNKEVYSLINEKIPKEYSVTQQPRTSVRSSPFSLAINSPAARGGGIRERTNTKLFENLFD